MTWRGPLWVRVTVALEFEAAAAFFVVMVPRAIQGNGPRAPIVVIAVFVAAVCQVFVVRTVASRVTASETGLELVGICSTRRFAWGEIDSLVEGRSMGRPTNVLVSKVGGRTRFPSITLVMIPDRLEETRREIRAAMGRYQGVSGTPAQQTDNPRLTEVVTWRGPAWRKTAVAAMFEVLAVFLVVTAISELLRAGGNALLALLGLYVAVVCQVVVVRCIAARVVADDHGLELSGLWRTRRYRWAEVRSFDEGRFLRRHTNVLILESGDRRLLPFLTQAQSPGPLEEVRGEMEAAMLQHRNAGDSSRT